VSEPIDNQIENLGNFSDLETVDNNTLAIQVELNSSRPLSEKLNSTKLLDLQESNQLDENER
jgi:hypothetical protein